MATTTSSKKESNNPSIEYTPYGFDQPIAISVADVIAILCHPTKQGVVCSEADAIKFMNYCHGHRLNPWTDDVYLLGYDRRDKSPVFRPVISIYTFLKRAEGAPNFNGILSGVLVAPGWECSVCHGAGVGTDPGWVSPCLACSGTGVRDEVIGDVLPRDDQQKLRGGWAIVKIKDRELPVKVRVLLERFSGYSEPWREDPAGMITKVARVHALRTAYPSALGNLYTREEMDAETEERRSVPAAVSAPEFDGPRMAAPGKPAPETARPAPRKPVEPTGQTAPVEGARKTEPARPEPARPEPARPESDWSAPEPEPPPKRQEREDPQPHGHDYRPGSEQSSRKRKRHQDDDDLFDDAPKSAPKAQAELDPPRKPEDTEPASAMDIRKLTGLMINANVSDEQVVMFCVNEKRWVPHFVELEELPQRWIRELIRLWDQHLPHIQAIDV